jgi:hypothetical protein
VKARKKTKRQKMLEKSAKKGRELFESDPAEAMARSQQASERLLNEAVKPNAEKIARIMFTGAVAVVVHALADEGAKEGARNLGWDGRSTVFELSPAKLKWFASVLRGIGDSAAADWLMNGAPGRMFVMTGYGTLCLNHEVGRGWTAAPGTSDFAPNN